MLNRFSTIYLSFIKNATLNKILHENKLKQNSGIVITKFISVSSTYRIVLAADPMVIYFIIAGLNVQIIMLLYVFKNKYLYHLPYL